MNLSEKYEALAGAVSYREIAHGAVPWLTDELVQTGAARARLRRWAEAGGLTREPSRADLEGRLVYLGDEGIRAVLVGALERIAPPARDLVLDRAWFLGVGRSANGWVGIAPPALEADEEPLRLIALAGHLADGELAGVVAHECAHAWLSPATNADVKPVAVRRDLQHATVTLAAEWGQLDHVRALLVANRRRDEEQATALVRAWGFVGPAADGARCALGAQQIVIAEMAEMLAREGGAQ